MILYFSGTGNSRFAAEYLAKQLGDRAVDTAGWLRHGIAAELTDDKPFVLVAPTHGWQLPQAVEGFLQAATFAGSSELYVVMTCGSEIGAPQKRLQAICREKGLHFGGVAGILMPENYIILFEATHEEDCAALVRDAAASLDAVAETIRAGELLPRMRPTVGDRLKSAVVSPLFRALVVNSRGFRVTEACRGCGRCAELCPIGNITMQDGVPVWEKHCAHCMACICSCPKEAIEYGRLTVGKRRYRFPQEAVAEEQIADTAAE